MNTDIVFCLAELAAAGYFFYKLGSKKEHRGANGFAAGVFLIAFIFHAAPIFSKIMHKILIS